MENLNPICKWPTQERPRERLLELGAAALSDAELVAILLGHGSRGCSALLLAQLVLQTHGGLNAMGKVSPSRLSSHSGIGPAKAARFFAACEIGRRRERRNPRVNIIITSPADAARIASARLRDLTRECCMAIFLDSRHRVLKEELISIGGLNHANIHPRDLFKSALELSAAALILAHNHPSGDPNPSVSDIKLTAQLYQAAKLLGISFLDHVIIGDGEFISLMSEGYFSNSGGEPFGKRKCDAFPTKSTSNGLCHPEQKSF